MEEAVIGQLGSEETAGKILSGVTQWWCLEDGLCWNPVLGAGRSFAPWGLRGSEALKVPYLSLSHSRGRFLALGHLLSLGVRYLDRWKQEGAGADPSPRDRAGGFGK